jgi:penicillin-binding protein-related factor A (putative recombinase)
MKPELEQQVQKRLINYLRLKHRIFCWKSAQIGTFDPTKKLFRSNNSAIYVKGVADILGITKNGSMVAFEVKRDVKSAKPSPDQIRFLNDIIDHGGIAGVVKKEEHIDRIIDLHTACDRLTMKRLINET